MHIGCTLAPYLCINNKPKGLRQVNPKFNFVDMNEQKKVFGDFEIWLSYEDLEDSQPNYQFYHIHCYDTLFGVKMAIDVGMIKKNESFPMEDAVAQVKEYFRCRLDQKVWWENFARP